METYPKTDRTTPTRYPRPAVLRRRRGPRRSSTRRTTVHVGFVVDGEPAGAAHPARPRRRHALPARLDRQPAGLAARRRRPAGLRDRHAARRPRATPARSSTTAPTTARSSRTAPPAWSPTSDEKAGDRARWSTRSAPAGPPTAARRTRKELAQTAVLALPLREVSVKRPHRRGQRRAGRPRPAALGRRGAATAAPPAARAGRPGVTAPRAGLPAPTPARPGSSRRRCTAGTWSSSRSTRARRRACSPRSPTPRSGRTCRWPAPRRSPRWPRIVAAALADPGRAALVQRDANSGEIVGTTSLLRDRPGQPLDRHRPHHARPALVAHRRSTPSPSCCCWQERSTTLGAVRVDWYTDIRNDRSQAAIDRLGATREGVLRAHKRRPDGTWRDTVVYAMTADGVAGRRRLRLTARGLER